MAVHLKDLIPWTRSAINAGLRRIGYEVRRLDRVAPVEPYVQAEVLPEVDCVIDVGVAEGTDWLYERYPTKPLFLFDPLDLDATLSARLSDRDMHFFQTALGAEPATLTLNVPQSSRRSSLLPRLSIEVEPGDEAVEPVSVPVARLDDFAPHLEGFSRLGLKIDTEGYEMAVLQGAETLLERCAFVVTETSLFERFADSYHFNDMHRYMNDHGFQFRFVLNAGIGTNGYIRCVDAVFLRQGESLRM